MKITFILVFVFSLQLSAHVYSQERFSFNYTQASIERIFDRIQQESAYRFFYNNKYLKDIGRIDLQVSNASLPDILHKILDTRLSYRIINGYLVVISPAATIEAQIPVKGRVTDSLGHALPGVTIKVKNATLGTSTDEKGEFTLVVPDDAVLVVSYIGYQTQDIPVAGRKEINITMRTSASGLNEVVVVGYGTQKKVDVTGAVSTIQGKELNTATNSNLTNMLAGKLPGLRVVQRTGEPGDYSTDFDIRGLGSPLIIVDGVPNGNFNMLDPNEIASISVLKDASAAVYGVRAANGVILVTTKRGKEGEVRLNYSGTYGWASPTNTPQVMNAFQYATLVDDADFNTGKTTPTFSSQDLEKFKNGTYPSTNWQDLIMRRYAPQMHHNLSASGGTDKIKYFLSLGYYNEEGTWKSGDLNYKRYNFRSNITAQITKDLQAELLIDGIQDNKNQPGAPTWLIFKSIWMQKPTIPVYANNNPLYLSAVADATHPLAITNHNIGGYIVNTNKYFQGSFALNYSVPYIAGLKARFMYSYNSNYSFNKQWQKMYALYNYDNASGTYVPGYANDPSKLSERYSDGYLSLVQTSLNYEKTFLKKHKVDALLLFEQYKQNSNDLYGSKQFSLDAVDQLYAGNSLNQTINNDATTELANQGLVGRINYDYNGKYLVEGSFRYDGSSKFAPGHQWGLFPAFSAGWRLSEEPFIKNNIPYLTNLKLRGSWGRMGDDRASTFQFLSGYNYPGANYIFNNTVISGLGFRGMANPNITWYESTTADIGLDGDLWNGLLDFSLDAFRRRRDNLLDTRALSLPQTVGASLPQENLDSDMTLGFEVQVSHTNTIGKFTYNVTGNISATRTKWLYKEESQPGNAYLKWRKSNKDRWSDILWGYGVAGVFTSQAEIYGSPVQDGQGNRTLLPGDIKYQDYNGDGVIDANDIHQIGRSNTIPEINYGLTFNLQWNGFDLNLLFQGATNFQISYLGSDQLVQPMPWGRNGLAMFLNRWHKADPFEANSPWVPGKYPPTRPSGTFPLNYMTSTFWLNDASYLRLKSMEVGYTVPAKWLGKKSLKALRVFANGFDLLTWTGLKFIDPEHTSQTYGYLYPITKNYNVGVNVTF